MRSSQTKQKRFIFKSRKLSHDCCFKFNIVANIETIQQSLAIYQDVGIIDGRNPHSDISRAKFPMVRNSIITSSRLSTFVSVSMGGTRRSTQRNLISAIESGSDGRTSNKYSSSTSTPIDRCGAYDGKSVGAWRRGLHIADEWDRTNEKETTKTMNRGVKTKNGTMKHWNWDELQKCENS